MPVYEYAGDDAPLFVSESDYVQFRFKAPTTWDTEQTVTVRIGDLDTFWLIKTIPEDLIPDPFPFENILDAEPDTMYTYADGTRPTEQIIEVTGLTPTSEADVFITSNLPPGDINSYAMRIDYTGDGTWDTGTSADDYWVQTAPAPVENGAKIQVRGFSRTNNNQSHLITLRIGPTANETWRIQTKPVPDNTPDPLPDFGDKVDKPLSIFIYSDVKQIAGLSEDAPFILQNGQAQWSKLTGNQPTFTTSINSDGEAVLQNGTAFTNANGTVANGDWVQLRIPSSGNANTPVGTDIQIGNASLDGSNGLDWTVLTGDFPSENPTPFSFTNLTEQEPDTLIASDVQPPGGITGLGSGVSVPVTVVDTDSDEVKVKVNNGSIGDFPASVSNGDQLQIFLKTGPVYGASSNRFLRVKVGALTLLDWTVDVSSGPDTDADFNIPPNLNGQNLNTYVTSAAVFVTGINQPITISSTVGSISIDGAPPTSGDKTFDPAVNTYFTLTLLTASVINTPEQTTVTVGTGPSNEFVWRATTYLTPPVGITNAGTWYSIKTPKQDGYSVGTVIPILKLNSIDQYGDLDGSLGDRYPGWIACDGRQLDASSYYQLWEAIGNTYGGNAEKDFVDITYNGQVIGQSVVYTGNFNLPDYRNRRLAGAGLVDNQNGGSAFLTPSNGDNVFDVGSEGGYWYFDKVDALGSQPLEQIQNPVSGATSGLISDFFSLGTIRVQNLTSVTTDIEFTITGDVNAVIGPLQQVIVPVPVHDHLYLSAVVEAEDGEPVIPWGLGGQGGKTLFKFGEELKDQDISVQSTEDAHDGWFELISGTQLVDELRAYYGNSFDLMDWIESNLPDGFPVNQQYEGLLDSVDGPGDEDDDEYGRIPFTTWWLSNPSALNSATLQSTGGAVHQQTTSGVFDTEDATFRIDGYTPTNGQVRTHSHYLTMSPVADPNVDFSGGNEDGIGTKGAPFGQGLGNSGAAGAVQTFQLRETRSLTTAYDQGQYVNKSIGDWAYRFAGGSYWPTVPVEQQTYTDDFVMTNEAGSSGNGSGMILNITFQAYPSLGGEPLGDTRYRINTIVNAGSGYEVGDELSCTWWNDIPNSGNRLIRLNSVSVAGSGQSGATTITSFTQNEIFMGMTSGTFQLTTNIKQPVPDVTMIPQRTVPIFIPFYKSKYVIKAY